MALLGPVYREQLFPRRAYARAFEVLLAGLPARSACRTMVEILALAHERACEAELADALEALLDAGHLPEIADLRRRFVPDAAALPGITVAQPPLGLYEELATVRCGGAA
jgi:hypothetical protein